MPGNRASENGNHITARKYYRRNVVIADADDPTSTSIPTLDTRYYEVGYNDYVPSFYGIGQINVSAIFGDDINSLVLDLYLLSSDEELKTSAESSSLTSSSSGAPGTDDLWVHVATKTLTHSGLWIVENVPPGQYKILVSSIDGSGAVDIMTQHAA
jgi:hypothetical protein